MEKAINCNLAKVVSGLGINQSELMEKGKAYAIPCRPEAKTKVILTGNAVKAIDCTLWAFADFY
jgi:hypothetical protein